MKKWILWVISCLSLLWFSFAQVSVNPIYTSERFWPSDKFHAGCDNQINVVFHLNSSKINWVNAILHYDSDNVEILRIVANWEKENNLTYSVENDKIIFGKLKSDWDGLDNVVFSVFFKSLEGVESANFSFEKWSYIVDSRWNMVDFDWNYRFEFVEVPECDPDIVAPSVELIFPSNDTGEYVALDSYFQFMIDDSGKGINEDSIKIKIDSLEYTLAGIEHVWNDKNLTVYPDIWMPFNTRFEVEISVSDRQAYGKPNTTTKIYKFQTSDELNLLNKINPVEFRKIVNMNNYLRWTSDECKFLSKLYSNWNEENQKVLGSINDKLGCEKLSISEDFENITVIQDNNVNNISVFAMLGWILFGSLVSFMVFGWLKK